ncbi:MAG: hypothetical protein LBJ61_04125 [Deltaproteobacteria bacterium]|nr:hypothetical protein [Deltaproteobacteria bacterium]
MKRARIVTARSEPVRSETVKSEALRSETAKSVAVRPEPARVRVDNRLNDCRPNRLALPAKDRPAGDGAAAHYEVKKIAAAKKFLKAGTSIAIIEKVLGLSRSKFID